MPDDFNVAFFLVFQICHNYNLADRFIHTSFDDLDIVLRS